MPIHVLPSDVSSMIAAGEVTERPASVVKELIENSLDAGATEISIELRGGGVDLIRVVDNGVGIARDEAELAFQRFATSKLVDPSDLGSIATLGFRGEALPSIAAVSHATMVTRPPAETSGTRIEVSGGRVVGNSPEGAAPGTSVTVRQLFRNVPVRRKFLRSAAAEAGRTQTLVARYTLAYPTVRFSMRVEDSEVIVSTGSGDAREAVAAVYGAAVAEAMLELASPGPPDGGRAPRVSGMIAPGSVSRSNRNQVTIFVNGRWIQNRMLSYALQEAYHGFLPERRYPVAVVEVAMPYGDVDVNVHPGKSEVRFRHEGSVFAALQQAVRQTLTAHSPVPELGAASVPRPSPAQPAVEHSFWPVGPPGASVGGEPESQAVAGQPVRHEAHGTGPVLAAPSLAPSAALPSLRVLGQVQSTYIAAEGPDGVYLIDQHAAHERVLFERVKAEALAGAPEVQGLMEPVTIALDHRQSELLEAHGELVRQMGFQVEPFGGSAYILRGVSTLIGQSDPARSFLDVLDLMSEGGGFESWEDRAAYSIACHGAIRAGKTLTTEEMEELGRQLEGCEQPHTCPHGRPTMIHMSSARLEREFGRR